MSRFLFRRILVWFSNLAMILAALVTAFLLRFEFTIPAEEQPVFVRGLSLILLVKPLVFRLGGLDRGWWRFTGISDLWRILVVNVCASISFTVAAILIIGPAFPRSIYVLDFTICLLFVAGTRMVIRLYNEAVLRDFSKGRRKGVLIYGAGAAGVALLKDIRQNPTLDHEVLGFIDDDPAKRGALLHGRTVLGSGRDLLAIVERQNARMRQVEEIIIAMPSASGSSMQEVVANCRVSGLPFKTIPGLGELVSGRVSTRQIREIAIGDLLGREAVHLEEASIRNSIFGKSVLVTGGAGSIGSELCKQVAMYEPKRLVILDNAESGVFRIEMDLRQRFSALGLVPEIADVRDARRMEEVVRQHKVDVVFHAAAYKHVPMMETQVLEAASNNIIGTLNVVLAAKHHGASRFVMISSDKAVNPTSVMGTTKRVAEIIVSTMSSGNGGFKGVSVRFGNVLGSNGSVIPLFQSQIQVGGPVTVTHPEVRRYFMTTREAVQLVLQASTMGTGAEVFILDMGEPIRILDLARNMIRLSGLKPEEDIDIRFTGLRPGEKLFEELTTNRVELRKTEHEKIGVWLCPQVEARQLDRWLVQLKDLLQRRDVADIVEHMRVLVPEYVPSTALQETALGKFAAIGA
jgi:FlaA1/EpsC-like NDP-sugar epimerase